MPERGFNTGFWSEPFVQKQPQEGKILYAYLKTNDHCNQAGLYVLTLMTISFETGIDKTALPDLLQSLTPEVEWYPEESLVWVKGFLAEQAKSPKFIAAALACVKKDRMPEELAEEFQEYNSQLIERANIQPQLSLTKRECVIIRDNFQCQYCHKVLTAADYEMDHIVPKIRGGKDNYLNLVASCQPCNLKKLDKTPQEAGLPVPNATSFHAAQALFILKNNPIIKQKWVSLFPGKAQIVESILNNIEESHSILAQDTPFTASASKTVSRSIPDNKIGVVKGEGEEEISPSESEIEESLSAGDREVISAWFSVKGFSMPNEEAAELVARLRTEFPEVDILAESKAWAARKLSEPLTPKTRPSAQIWNWIRKARQFAQERRTGEQGQRVRGARSSADFRGGKW